MNEAMHPALDKAAEIEANRKRYEELKAAGDTAAPPRPAAADGARRRADRRRRCSLPRGNPRRLVLDDEGQARRSAFGCSTSPARRASRFSPGTPGTPANATTAPTPSRCNGRRNCAKAAFCSPIWAASCSRSSRTRPARMTRSSAARRQPRTCANTSDRPSSLDAREHAARRWQAWPRHTRPRAGDHLLRAGHRQCAMASSSGMTASSSPAISSTFAPKSTCCRDLELPASACRPTRASIRGPSPRSSIACPLPTKTISAGPRPRKPRAASTTTPIYLRAEGTMNLTVSPSPSPPRSRLISRRPSMISSFRRTSPGPASSGRARSCASSILKASRPSTRSSTRLPTPASATARRIRSSSRARPIHDGHAAHLQCRPCDGASSSPTRPAGTTLRPAHAPARQTPCALAITRATCMPAARTSSSPWRRTA